jgi:type IV pilus assembly protein PilA
MLRQKGFSLIELLIVVTVILIITAIAVPNLLRTRLAANESSAVATVRTINIAQVTYASTWINTGYTGLQQLGGAAPCNNATALAACLLDPVISTAPFQKSGFIFASAAVGAAPATQYTVNADPVQWNRTGGKHFYSDETSVIRFNLNNAPATAASTPVN